MGNILNPLIEQFKQENDMECLDSEFLVEEKRMNSKEKKHMICQI